MTDITELVQRMKSAAEKATPGEWVYFPKNTSIEYDVGSDESQGSILYVDSGDFTQAQTDRNGEFIALANPANILALVEALEKAQHEAAVDWEAAASLNVENQDLKRRIAELQSSHAKLRDVMASIHNTILMDGAYTPLAAILNAAKRADEESASAAGIKLDVQPAQSCEHSMFWDASGVKRCSKCDRAEPGSRTVTVKLPKRITNIDLRTPLEVEDMWIARIKEMLATAGIREAE